MYTSVEETPVRGGVTDSATKIFFEYLLEYFMYRDPGFRLQNDLYCVAWGVKLY